MHHARAARQPTGRNTKGAVRVARGSIAGADLGPTRHVPLHVGDGHRVGQKHYESSEPN